MHKPAQPGVQLWFDFGSTYSYVAVMRAERLCAEAGVELAWKPFLLGPIFNTLKGIQDSPFNVEPVRGRYMWRDLERLCAKYGLPWRKPTRFPRNGLLAARVALAGEGSPWLGGFIRAVFHANFAEDRDIAEPALVAALLESQGQAPEPVLARATSPEGKARLRVQTEEASQHGLFGAPSLRVGGELFFGQDRLEDAIAWALRAGGG